MPRTMTSTEETSWGLRISSSWWLVLHHITTPCRKRKHRILSLKENKFLSALQSNSSQGSLAHDSSSFISWSEYKVRGTNFREVTSIKCFKLELPWALPTSCSLLGSLSRSVQLSQRSQACSHSPFLSLQGLPWLEIPTTTTIFASKENQDTWDGRAHDFDLDLKLPRMTLGEAILQSTGETPHPTYHC